MRAVPNDETVTRSRDQLVSNSGRVNAATVRVAFIILALSVVVMLRVPPLRECDTSMDSMPFVVWVTYVHVLLAGTTSLKWVYPQDPHN